MQHINPNFTSFHCKANFLIVIFLICFGHFSVHARTKRYSIKVKEESEVLKSIPTKPQGYRYFKKGFYFEAQAIGGIAYNERVFTSYANWFYGLDMAAGYRFYPQLTFAAGFGGYSYFTKTSRGYSKEFIEQTTSIPVFIRLRSEFLDKKFSPYAQLDFGYAFIILNSHEAGDKIKYNNEVFMDRIYLKGYKNLEDYKADFEQAIINRYSSDNIDSSDLETLVNQKWSEEYTKLKMFSNGRQDYIACDNAHLQYGKRGFFGNLDFGLSYLVGESSRLHIGLSIGVSQSYYGTYLRTADNKFLPFGRIDYLPANIGQEPIPVRILGTKNFKDSFDFDLMLKFGISF